MLFYRDVEVIEDDLERIKLNVALHHVYEKDDAKRKSGLTFKLNNKWYLVDCLDFYQARDIIRKDNIDLTHIIVAPGLKGVFPAYLNSNTCSFVTHIKEWDLLSMSEYRGFFNRTGMIVLTHPIMNGGKEREIKMIDSTLKTKRTDNIFKMWAKDTTDD